MRPRRIPHLTGSLAVLLAGCALTGCAQAMRVRTDRPGSRVVVDGHVLGPVPEEGTLVMVPPGHEDVPYEIVPPDGEGTVAKVGKLARTEIVWWTLAGGIGAAVCCAPTLAGVGLCIANPALLLAPVSCLAAGGNPAVFMTALAAPTWATLPCVALGAAAGLMPLGVAFVAETPPRNVRLVNGAQPPPVDEPMQHDDASESPSEPPDPPEGAAPFEPAPFEHAGGMRW